MVFFILQYLYIYGSAHYYLLDDTLAIKRDSSFTITLSASMGEGYTWKLMDMPDSSYVSFVTKTDRQPKVDGASVVQEFLFTAKPKGQWALEFTYSQPWLREKSLKFKYKKYLIVIQ